MKELTRLLAYAIAPLVALWAGVSLSLKYRNPLPLALAFAAIAAALTHPRRG